MGLREGRPQIESFGRACLDEPMPGKTWYRKVPGVELGELAHVERDPLRRLPPTDNLTLCDGVLAGVLRYDVVCYVEDERRPWRTLEVPEGASTSTRRSIWSGSIFAFTCELLR